MTGIDGTLLVVDDSLQQPVEREVVAAAVRRALAVANSPDGVREPLALDS
jgi:hypothetical protein